MRIMVNLVLGLAYELRGCEVRKISYAKLPRRDKDYREWLGVGVIS